MFRNGRREDTLLQRMSLWKLVTWGWLEKGNFDGLKYITLDFSTRIEENTKLCGWIRHKKLMDESYNFLTGVDMARKFGRKGKRRCVGLREFTIRGLVLDTETKSAFQFWFGEENVSFVEEISPRGRRRRQIPSVTCRMIAL